MHIGVFDSGIGGQIVAEALQVSFPMATLTVVNDRDHLPYGDKTSEEIISLTNNAITPLINGQCDMIVIACNSATTAAIEWLRKTYPDQLFIGIEPMIKPAAELTETGVIAVCATPATLVSQHYKDLRKTYADELVVIEPDCSNWAQMIEENHVNEANIEQILDTVTNQKADVIVLGCTHYHWIKDFIVSHVGSNVHVLEPSEAIGRRVNELLYPTSD